MRPVRTVLLILIFALTACATPYQPNKTGFGVRGGFNDFQVEPGQYYVSFDANNLTDKTIAMKYWHQRAGELCPSGYDMLSNESRQNARLVSGDGNIISDTRIEGYIQCR